MSESEVAITALVERIIQSKSFGTSKTYANLLRFLVSSTLAGTVPKEIIIGSKIFGKADFDPSQSSQVRVYAYNLRKKLADYFAKEGREETHILRIPKGSYRIVYEKKMEKAARPFLASSVKIWQGAFLASLLFSTVLLFQLYAHRTTPTYQLSTLWGDFFQSQQNYLVVLGDFFIYHEQNTATGTSRNIRDVNVNSLADFEAMPKSEDSLLQYSTLTYTYLARNSVLWIKELSKIFGVAEQDFAVRLMSRLNPKEMSDYNLVVVGLLKTLGLFQRYAPNSAFTYNPENGVLTYKNPENGQELTYQPRGDADLYHTDYALIAKIPGPNNNVIFLFGGLWDTATSQSLKTLTDEKLSADLATQLKAKYGKIPAYFEVLAEVSGLDRMELATNKILHMHALE